MSNELLSTNHWPMISIVMPTKNGEQFIKEALDSIIIQKYPNLEIIVMDGISTDKTVEIVEGFQTKVPNLKLYIEQDNGQSQAMNRGISRAQGDIIGILNCDDFYSPGTFFEAAASLQASKNPTFLVGNCSIIDHKKNLLSLQKPNKLGLEYWYFGLQSHPANSSQYFYHKNIHNIIGGYPEDEHFAMDLWFYLECCISQTIDKIYVNRNWGNYRCHQKSKTVLNRNNHRKITVYYRQKYTKHLHLKSSLKPACLSLLKKIKSKLVFVSLN